MKFALQMIAVFTLSLIIDIFWTKYNLAISARRATGAGLWSAAIVLGGTFSTQIWLDNRWTVLAGILGAFIGTYYTVKHEKAPV